jgi:hypothetical protein
MPFVKGESGNPNGRPLGARNKATLAVEAILAAEGEDLARGLIGRAREGDLGALRFCLDRVVLRGADRPIHFALPRITTGAAALEAAGEIMTAAGAGGLTPRQAGDLLRVVERGARAIAAAEAAERAADRGEPDELASWAQAQNYWKGYWKEKFEAQYGALIDLPATTPRNGDETGQGSTEPVAARHAQGRDAESAMGPRPLRDEVERGAGGDRIPEPVVPEAGAGLPGGANNNAKNNGNNGNNGNNESSTALAWPGCRDHGAAHPWPLTHGWPGVPAAVSGTADCVLSRWRGGDAPKTDTAIGLILRKISST